MRERLGYLFYVMRTRPLFGFGVVTVLLSFVLAAVGPLITPWPPTQANPADFAQPPSARHWFGTDLSGMDIFSRVIAAPRVDVTIGLAGALLSATLGTVLGLLAGYYTGLGSQILMRISDVVNSFPSFVLGMILVALAGRNITNVIFTLGALYTPIFLRLTRSEVMSVKERPFVEAARAVGNSELKVAFRHVLPNSLTPTLIQLSVTVGWGILLTAGLSFVGAGVRPPTPEWGGMIAAGAPQIILGEWWPSVFPGAVMAFMVFGYACVGDGLQHFLGRR
jgi:peptide/nickel transport system permease protein